MHQLFYFSALVGIFAMGGCNDSASKAQFALLIDSENEAITIVATEDVQFDYDALRFWNTEGSNLASWGVAHGERNLIEATFVYAESGELYGVKIVCSVPLLVNADFENGENGGVPNLLDKGSHSFRIGG
jgi:hypothetical protein